MPATITEKHVLEIWQRSLRQRTELKTVTNEPVSIIYPGRRNDDRGADFKDAILATGAGQLKGDIEIHVKTSHWWAHRHHQDPAYNRVILHVVYQNDTAKAIVQANGLRVPTVALGDDIENDHAILPSLLPCRGTGYSGHANLIASRLDEAGEARFRQKASGLKETMTQSGRGQALYQSVMTALGYAKNKAAMAELARQVPLASLETAASNALSDNEYLVRCQARLMGTAGLLPAQRGESSPNLQDTEDWVAGLENTWAGLHQTAGMSVKDWNFFKVRPGNHPVRRIAAMSYLLLRYRKSGLLAGLEARLKAAATAADFRSLEAALMVPPEGYWGYCLDFGLPALGVPPALLGKERAADIIVNTLLPFAYAQGPAGAGEKALSLYRVYRAPAENTIVKHMRRQLGISRYLINTALRQQGLIHLYQTQCLEGKCNECPLGHIPG